MACTEPKPVCEVGAELGEGPMWDERGAVLWFVDIKNDAIHRYDPASGTQCSWKAPEYTAFIFPASSGGFIAGLPLQLVLNNCYDPAKNPNQDPNTPACQLVHRNAAVMGSRVESAIMS